jgi:hypothetical protein
MYYSSPSKMPSDEHSRLGARQRVGVLIFGLTGAPRPGSFDETLSRCDDGWCVAGDGG